MNFCSRVLARVHPANIGFAETDMWAPGLAVAHSHDRNRANPLCRLRRRTPTDCASFARNRIHQAAAREDSTSNLRTARAPEYPTGSVSDQSRRGHSHPANAVRSKLAPNRTGAPICAGPVFRTTEFIGVGQTAGQVGNDRKTGRLYEIPLPHARTAFALRP
jgi:hypothetical protein